MEFRTLGRSGLKVPVFSMGTATFGQGDEFFRAIGTTDVAEATRLVDICLDAGVNMFDTADIYHGGLSEEILGKAIGKRRDKILISTKATFKMGPGHNEIGSSRYHLIRACEASLRRLNTDYIDLYQMHGFDALTPVEETLSALNDLVHSGKVRYIGCSNFSGWHLMKSLDVSEKYGWTRYVAHQAYYSLVGREYEWELMPLGLDQGVGCVVWSPLGWGRLTGKIRRGKPLHENSRLHKTAVNRPSARGRICSQGCGRAGRSSEGNGQVGPADRPQLAPAAPHRLKRNPRRAQRRTIAAKPRRARLESHSPTSRETRRRQRHHPRLPLLAPAPIHRPQSPSHSLMAAGEFVGARHVEDPP